MSDLSGGFNYFLFNFTQTYKTGLLCWLADAPDAGIVENLKSLLPKEQTVICFLTSLFQYGSSHLPSLFKY